MPKYETVLHLADRRLYEIPIKIKLETAQTEDYWSA